MKAKIISLLMVIVFGLMLFGTNPVLASNNSQDIISDIEAWGIANYYIRGYSNSIQTWQGASVSNVNEYYTDDRISAYEFKISKEGMSVGFIMISARKDWMPVLEFGTGNAPSDNIEKAKKVAKENDLLDENDNGKPKYYYGGATFFSAQIGDKMKQKNKIINLFDMKLIDKPDKVELKMDKQAAKNTWNKLLSEYMAGSAPDQLLLNTDMETESETIPGCPEYWTLEEGTNAIYAQSSDQYYNGTHSLALSRNGTDCAVDQTIANYSDYNDQE